MIRSFYRATDGSLSSDLSDAALRDALASGTGTLWLDFQSAAREEGTVLSGVFHFHQLAIDDCYNEHIDPAKVDDFGDYLFLIAQAISFDDASQTLETTELDLFLGANYVVSFHARPLHFVDEVHRRCREEGPELRRGADFLAHALLDGLVDDYQPAMDKLDETLGRVEERVLEQPHAALLQEILRLKHNVQQLRRTIIPQRDVVNHLSRGEFATLIHPETQIYFRDIYDHVVRVQELMESVRDLADGVLNTYLSSVNNRMNDVMKTLSVVASILLPLTFIASIYGMNFENMPELEWEYGYFMALGIMATVAISLVLFFRWRKWF